MPAARPGQRQPFDQEQVLDPQNLLHVGAPVDARRPGSLGNAKFRKFRLPRAQHVRLHLREVANLDGLEERAIRDLDL